MDEMNDVVVQGLEVDVQRIIEENKTLREELARREDKENSERRNMLAREELAKEYEDFTELFEGIEATLSSVPALLDLAPTQRYRIGYLMLKGEKSLSKENCELTEEQVISFLNKYPKTLLHFVKGRKDASSIPGFFFDKSVGIRNRAVKAPQNLTEAHHAAIRYAKIRKN